MDRTQNKKKLKSVKTYKDWRMKVDLTPPSVTLCSEDMKCDVIRPVPIKDSL